MDTKEFVGGRIHYNPGLRRNMNTPILKYFTYSHLPDHLQMVSKPIAELAMSLDAELPAGPEKSAGLRKLLEAKDCFVRCALWSVLVEVLKEADEPDDPWAHRSKGMRCVTCMWFVEKPAMQTCRSQEQSEPVSLSAPLGRCRRHCPTMTGYPAVFGCDWCGDHKLDERK